MLDIIRPSMLVAMANPLKIYNDDEKLGKIKNNRAMYILLEPGEYSLGDKKNQIELEVEANKAYYIKVKLKVGLLGPSGTYEILDNDDGQELLDEVKKVEEF